MKDLGHNGDLYIYVTGHTLPVVKIEHLQVTVDVVILKKPHKPQR